MIPQCLAGAEVEVYKLRTYPKAAAELVAAATTDAAGAAAFSTASFGRSDDDFDSRYRAAVWHGGRVAFAEVEALLDEAPSTRVPVRFAGRVRAVRWTAETAQGVGPAPAELRQQLDPSKVTSLRQRWSSGGCTQSPSRSSGAREATSASGGVAFCGAAEAVWSTGGAIFSHKD